MFQLIIMRIFRRPLYLVLVPYALSFTAWLIPMDWYGRYWRFANMNMSFQGYEFLVVWLFLMITALIIGESVGNISKGTIDKSFSYEDKSRFWYYTVSIFGIMGFLYSVAQVIHAAGFGFLIQSMNRGTANDIHDKLYANYSAGVGSLRYLTILSGGCALYLIINGEKDRALSIVNITFMVASALISSRLSLIAATVVFLVIQARSGRSLPIRQILIAFIGIILLLTLANVTRNKNYYAAAGITNPYSASLAEGLTYLSAPFQGTLAAMEAVATGDYDASNGIDPNLTTNSAAEDLVKKYSPWMTYGLLPIIVGICAAIYTIAFKASSLSLVAGAGGWGYAFCEIWRVMLFGQGIFWVLFTFGFLLPIAIEIFYPRATRLNFSFRK